MDASWTAEKVATDFLKPRFEELLGAASKKSDDSEEQRLREQTGVKNEDEAKAEVRKQRAKHGTALQVSCAVLGDRDYQILGRQINAPIMPLRQEYLDSIGAFADGRLATAQWQGGRSCAWRVTALKVAGVLADADTLKRCGIGHRRSCPFPVEELARGPNGVAQALVAHIFKFNK